MSTCPVCNNETLIEGDRVYIDLGHSVQVDPDHCDFCGYIQPRTVADFIDIEITRKCWQLQFLKET